MWFPQFAGLTFPPPILNVAGLKKIKNVETVSDYQWDSNWFPSIIGPMLIIYFPSKHRLIITLAPSSDVNRALVMSKGGVVIKGVICDGRIRLLMGEYGLWWENMTSDRRIWILIREYGLWRRIWIVKENMDCDWLSKLWTRATLNFQKFITN